jgi:hypothetical protein
VNHGFIESVQEGSDETILFFETKIERVFPVVSENRKGRVQLTLPLSVIHKQIIILRLPSMPFLQQILALCLPQ